MHDAAERLLELAAPPDQRTARLSVVGLCKNAGKTVTLNHLIRAAARRRIPLGLVSTGRDGEAEDTLTKLPKPRIWAPAGTWIAAALPALEAGSAAVEIHRVLPFSTPLGPVALGRVAREGEVLLTGPGSAQRVGVLLGAMESLGAALTMVDGAFDRMAAAAPAVTGRMVLAAGAAYSPNMAATVAQVAHLVDLFGLPGVPPQWEAAVERAAAQAPVTVLRVGGEAAAATTAGTAGAEAAGSAASDAAESAALEPAGTAAAATVVPVSSPLGDPAVIADWAEAEGRLNPSSRTLLVLDGALGDPLLQMLIQRRAFGIGLVAADAARILVDRRLWQRWRRRGGRVYVRRQMQLLAITTNPWSPVGQGYDPGAFTAAVAAAAGGRPVFDLEGGAPCDLEAASE